MGIGIFLILQFLQAAFGQILAPSAQEVRYSFESTVVIEKQTSYKPLEIAELQASHLFGIFASPENIRKFGLDPEKVGGLGAPKKNMGIEILSRRQQDGKWVYTYRSAGTFILHKKAAAILLRKKSLRVSLPLEPLTTYDIKCTDPHYNGFGDFWYFYNPFRSGCEYLYRPPVAIPVEIKIQHGLAPKKDISPRLDLLRANNGNGNLFSIYVIQGYYESSQDPRDDGFKSFKLYNGFLRSLSFQEKEVRAGTSYPLSIFTGTLTLSSGKIVDVEIRHLLVESGAESRNVSFAKFFKEAVEQGDVVIYSGHSGLGSNLDIPYLESKAGKFNFPAGKRQIFWFESCASYSYYLDHFRFQKTRATIDVVTNGLSSYFETGHDLLKAFTVQMLNPVDADKPWLKILQEMESPLEGGSYLLNVGGL